MSEEARPSQDEPAPPRARGGSWLRTLRAVGWSFIGIRQSSEYKEDLARLNPFHVIAVALLGVLVFVAGLIVLVNWVVAK